VWFNWSPPRLPEWALPEDEPTLNEQPKPTNGKQKHTNRPTWNGRTLEDCDRILNTILKEIGVKKVEQTDAIYQMVTNGKVANRDQCHAEPESKFLVTAALEKYTAKLKQNGRPLSDALQEAGVANEQMQPA